MKPASTYKLLDDALRTHVPDDVNLLPHLATQYAKGQSKMKIRTKFTLGVALALIAFAVALFTQPGVAQALQRLFGYLPGVGVVDQSAGPRKLAGPVSRTRDGITITVKSANTSTEVTTIDLDFKDIPASAIPSNPPEPGVRECDVNSLYLRYPDGSVDKVHFQAFIGLQEPAYWTWYFGPIPARFDTAVLVMPCIPGTKPGTVSENWEFPLRFVPVSAAELVPVTEIPTSLPTPPVIGPTPTSGGLYPGKEDFSLILDKVVPLPDGDVLYGRLEWAKDSLFTIYPPEDFVLTDANGQDIPMKEMPSDQSSWNPSMLGSPFFPLQFKTDGPIKTRGPVTLTLKSELVFMLGRSFDFDAGSHPQVGQQWLIDQDFQIGGRTMQVVSVTRLADGYDIVFHTDSADMTLDSVYPDPDRNFNITDVAESSDEAGTFHEHLIFGGEPPSGVLKVWFEVRIDVPGPWQVTWQP